MQEADERSKEEPSRFGRAARWWAAAGAFVVGLLVGGIVVGVVAGGSTPLPGGATAHSSGTGAALTSAPASAAGATGQVAVNQACLRALNAAQDIYGSLDDLANAAAQLNAARLDDVIQQLEPLQARLKQNLGDCKASATLPSGLTGSDGPTPTPTP